MRHTRLVFIGIILALLFAGLNVRAASAQGPTCLYVTATGHNIHGPFLAYYQANDGAENFGAPLTEAFLEGNVLVQCFERACLEFHPEYPAPYRVRVRLLGELLYGKIDPPIPIVLVPRTPIPGFQYFPATRQIVSPPFKKYFDAHGGWEILGYPISNVHFENGIFVQCFQRTCLDWNPLNNSVRPRPVGQIILDTKYPKNLPWRARAANDWCGLPIPTPTPAPTAVVLRTATPVSSPTPTPTTTLVPFRIVLHVQVRVLHQYVGLGGPQCVHVTVNDQYDRPFAGAALVAKVESASRVRVFPLLPTDAAGKSAFCFESGTEPPSTLTIIEVTAYWGAVHASGRDVFWR